MKNLIPVITSAEADNPFSKFHLYLNEFVLFDIWWHGVDYNMNFPWVFGISILGRDIFWCGDTPFDE